MCSGARAAGASSNYIDPSRAGVDAQGNCYLTGGCLAGSALQGTTLPFTGGYGDVFVAKYDSSGNLVWANSIAGNVDELPDGLAVDPMGNCYATGHNESMTMSIGAMTFTNTGPVFENGYVAKYDTRGDLLWAEILPFPSDGALDSRGNLYGCGSIFVSTNNTEFVSYFAAKISGPEVTIQPSGNQLVISWPTNAAGLNLEFTADLLGSLWSPVTNVPVPLGGQFTVTNDAAGPARYYRLRNF